MRKQKFLEVGDVCQLYKGSGNIIKRLNIKLKGVEYDKKFVFSDIGYNFEPSEIGAALWFIQLKN